MEAITLAIGLIDQFHFWQKFLSEKYVLVSSLLTKVTEQGHNPFFIPASRSATFYSDVWDYYLTIF